MQLYTNYVSFFFFFREFEGIKDAEGNILPKSERKPKRKCAVMLGYCGTGYNGLQIQNDPNVKTIERDLYTALHKAGAISLENSLDLKKSGFQRCARTDKGVHAAGNVVSLKMIIEDPEIKEKINEHLPQQIRIWGIQRTTKGFDCRKMCSSRVYEYLLPTYSLLNPKPHTKLAQLVDEKMAQNPQLFQEDDGEGAQFWKDVRQQVLDSGVSQEQLDAVDNYYATAALENPLSSRQNPLASGESTPVPSEIEPIIKKIKQLESKARRSYRISPTKLAHFRQAMQQYEGTHNFHNFTVGKTYKSPDSSRYIISAKVSEPFVIDDSENSSHATEWVSVKIHGQSFMLHQIRKMICMAALTVRCKLPAEKLLAMCFKPEKLNIPKAPALGLLLENPVFDAYNKILQENSYEPINFEQYEKEMLDFKMKNIYDKIYNDEVKENTFVSFFGYIDAYNVAGSEEDTTGGNNNNNIINNNNNGSSIFDFLHNYIDQETATKVEAEAATK